jgi:predicted RNA-binding Zn-ribbon protein involved in translation (DUF1610 family)
METKTVYCAKCKHDVSVTLTPQPIHDGQANVDKGAELVCLDFGPQCSGTLCSVFGLPRVVMGVRLARSGLRPAQFEAVRALCDGCHRVVSMRVVDETHAHCPDCGTVNIWTTVRLDGEEWVAVTGQRAEAEL